MTTHELAQLMAKAYDAGYRDGHRHQNNPTVTPSPADIRKAWLHANVPDDLEDDDA